MAAAIALLAGGTLIRFTLLAFGQSRLPAEIAGAFLNIDPLAGPLAGVVVSAARPGCGDARGAAILGGIALSRAAARPPAANRAPAPARAARA